MQGILVLKIWQCLKPISINSSLMGEQIWHFTEVKVVSVHLTSLLTSRYLDYPKNFLLEDVGLSWRREIQKCCLLCHKLACKHINRFSSRVHVVDDHNLYLGTHETTVQCNHLSLVNTRTMSDKILHAHSTSWEGRQLGCPLQDWQLMIVRIPPKENC